MDVKPGYKQTEVGVIPEDWDVRRLGDLGMWRGGMTPSMQNSDYWDGGHFPWISSGDVKFSRLTDTSQHVTLWAVRRGAAVVVPANSIVLVTRSGILRKYLPVALVERPMAINQDIKALLPNEAVISDFLLHALTGCGDQILARCLKAGTTVESVEFPWLKAFIIPLPPLPEQRAIAAALSDVDALLSGLDRLIAKKRDLKQAAMQQLLTGQTRLPDFHGEWEVKRLGEICEIAMGRTPPRLNQTYWGRGFVWLSIADLQSKVVSQSKEEITDLAAATMTIVPKGTLLMSFKLSIGRLCFAGCDLFTNEAICSFNKLQADADYLYYTLGRTDFSLYGKQAVKGYTLNKESLTLVEVRMPPLAEQSAIAAVLSDMDAELAALESRHAKTRDLKQAMMQELLTGRTRLV